MGDLVFESDLNYFESFYEQVILAMDKMRVAFK